MNNITTIGLDLAKRNFHFVVLNKDGKKISGHKADRADLISQLLKFPPTDTVIAMEACGGSHYWARLLMSLNFDVKVLKTVDVKAYAKTRQKNDMNDALSIAKTALDKDIKPIAIKSQDQQTIALVHQTRERCIKTRIKYSNALMANLHEFGYVTPPGHATFAKNATEHVNAAVEQGFVQDPVVTQILLEEAKEITRLLCKEKNITKQIAALNKENALAQRLMTIPGIGDIVASALSTLNIAMYETARDFAASLGLVPSQHTTGGQIRLSSITKTGNRYVRKMLVQGARCILIGESKGRGKEDTLISWGYRKRAGKGFNVASVALANKIARIAFALAKDSSIVYISTKGAKAV